MKCKLVFYILNEMALIIYWDEFYPSLSIDIGVLIYQILQFHTKMFKCVASPTLLGVRAHGRPQLMATKGKCVKPRYLLL
jgi:hypothetical protein